VTERNEKLTESEFHADDGRHWYVIHTYSGYENKVKQNLMHRIETMEMQEQIFRVIVPTE
jgi:transcriptional antiterminator NusG